MTDSVKAKVAEHHFKAHVSVGGKTLRKDEEKSVEVNTTLRNMVRAGNVVVTEGSLRPENDEKEFQGDDEGGETGEEDDGQDLNELTKDELKDLCEEQGLKKSGKKSELVERLSGN